MNAAVRRVRRRPRAFMTGSGSLEEERRWGEKERGVTAYTWKLERHRSYGWRDDSEKNCSKPQRSKPLFDTLEKIHFEMVQRILRWSEEKLPKTLINKRRNQ